MRCIASFIKPHFNDLLIIEKKTPLFQVSKMPENSRNQFATPYLAGLQITGALSRRLSLNNYGGGFPLFLYFTSCLND